MVSNKTVHLAKLLWHSTSKSREDYTSIVSESVVGTLKWDETAK